MNDQWIEKIRVFSGEQHPKACGCDHKLQNTGAVFYQSLGLLQCAICGGWQVIRKPIE